MANLVKIDKVFLYTDGAPSEAASADCVSSRAFLTTNAIPFGELWYEDPTQWPSVHAAISSWAFGPQQQARAVTQFPYVHWTEYYDDFSTQLNIAVGLAEIQACTLLANQKLITPLPAPAAAAAAAAVATPSA